MTTTEALVSSARPTALPRFARYAWAAALLCFLGMTASALLPPAVRGGALFGAGAATLGAALALPALRFGLPRGTSGVFAGFAGGFLGRMTVVAAGLVASGVRGSSAVAYAAAFFVVYALTQAIEIAYVLAASPPASGPRSLP